MDANAPRIQYFPVIPVIVTNAWKKAGDFSVTEMLPHILPKHRYRFVSGQLKKSREAKQSFNCHWGFIMNGV